MGYQKGKETGKYGYEAFSFVTVPKEPWAPKRKIVSSAQGSLLRQPSKEQMGKPQYHFCNPDPSLSGIQAFGQSLCGPLYLWELFGVHLLGCVNQKLNTSAGINSFSGAPINSHFLPS